MRIALVIERFEPSGGGMEAIAWIVAHALAAAGEEVHVIARTAAATDSVRVQRIAVPSRWQPLRVVAFARGAANATRGHFDVVHAFSRTLSQDIFRAGGGSHADYMQRAYSHAGAGWRRITPRHALLLRIERRIFDDEAQLIQCGSTMVRDEIAARFGVSADRLHVIHNGVDSERFRPGASAAQARRELPGAPSVNGPVWLFAGSGWRRKGADTAIAALARSGNPNARLWLVGRDHPAPWRALARRSGVADRVDFLGPRADMDRVYRASNALLLPSRYDAFANVCVEAAASGIPVVTSATNGSSELMQHCGLVVDDPEDVDAFADAIERLDDPALRRELGSRGREMALTLTWDKHVEHLRALYALALARRTPSGVRNGASKRPQR